MVTLAGPGAVNEEFEEGSVYISSSKGILAMGVRRDADTPLTGVANGDVTPYLVDDSGLLKTRLVKSDVSFGGGDSILNNFPKTGAAAGLISVAAVPTTNAGLVLGTTNGTSTRWKISYSANSAGTGTPAANTYHGIQVFYGTSILTTTAEKIQVVLQNQTILVDWIVPSGTTIRTRRDGIIGAVPPAGSQLSVAVYG